MRPFEYDALPGRVVFGVGAVARVGDEVERLGASRVLVIAGGHERAMAARIEAQLGTRVAGRFDDVRPHVPMELASEARAIARALDVDLLLTIGGGSTTGTGKAVALESGIPILAVPTTYAGSEMTPIWGITEDHRKTTGRDLKVLPRVVVYDPELTLSLPAGISAASGMNALAHCVEAIYAEGTNPIIGALATDGIRALAASLPIVARHPDDIEARTEVLYGAYLAGCALAGGGTGLHHKICHVLGGAYDLPHAEMHAVILPHAVAFNYAALPVEMRRLATALQVDDPAGALFDLGRSVGAPSALAEIGMREQDLDEAAELVATAVPHNPRQVDVASMRRLLGDAQHGRRPSIHQVQEV